MMRLVIPLLAMLFVTGCGPSVDEQMIRDNLQSMRIAIQSHQADEFMQHIDTSYNGMINFNRESLERFVNEHLDRNRVIYLYLAEVEISIEDNRAMVEFLSGIAGGPDRLPARGQLYKVRTEWLKDDEQWKLSRARWRPALLLNQQQ